MRLHEAFVSHSFEMQFISFEIIVNVAVAIKF